MNTSILLRKIRKEDKIQFTEDTQKYLKAFSKKHSLDSILKYLDGISNLKVLIIGEAILDEYQFGSSIGKAAKEPVVVLKYWGDELYLGGSLALANHLADFCKEVGLLAMLGDTNSYESFITKNLKGNIKPVFFHKKNSPTIVKRRIIDTPYLYKLVELYFINDSNLDKKQSRELLQKIKNLLPKYDLVICTDYGHSMINEETRKFLAEKTKFMALNAQANAGNIGYHTISSYPRADYVCLDEREIRLDCKEKNGNLEDLAKEVKDRLLCKNMSVTLGQAGSLVFNSRDLIRVPSFATKLRDAVGAGDAFLAVTAPLVYNNTPPEVVGFIGNAVGALAVGIVGNKESITKKTLSDFIKGIYSYGTNI